MVTKKKIPEYKLWHYKHPFTNGLFEWVKFFGALIGVGTLIVTSCVYRYLGVEIKEDNPSIHITFNPANKNNPLSLVPPHVDITFTFIVENHEFEEKIVNSDYILSPKKFQDLDHSPKWKFDNKKDITSGSTGEIAGVWLVNKAVIKPRSSVQIYTTYTYWTGDPLKKDFIREIACLESAPVTFSERIFSDGMEKGKKEIPFNLRDSAISEYLKWLISKDDDPKALKLYQYFLKKGMISNLNNGVYQYYIYDHP